MITRVIYEECPLLTEGRYECNLVKRHDGPCYSDTEKSRQKKEEKPKPFKIRDVDDSWDDNRCPHERG